MSAVQGPNELLFEFHRGDFVALVEEGPRGRLEEFWQTVQDGSAEDLRLLLEFWGVRVKMGPRAPEWMCE